MSFGSHFGSFWLPKCLPGGTPWATKIGQKFCRKLDSSKCHCKIAPRSPKTPPRASQELPNRPRPPQERPNSSREPPRPPQDTQKCSQETPSMPKNAQKQRRRHMGTGSPDVLPRLPATRPKTAPRHPKMLPRGPKYSPKRLKTAPQAHGNGIARRASSSACDKG